MVWQGSRRCLVIQPQTALHHPPAFNRPALELFSIPDRRTDHMTIGISAAWSAWRQLAQDRFDRLRREMG
jgi:hypothetical protein